MKLTSVEQYLMKRFAILFCLCSLVGCWRGAVDQAARSTALVDEQFAVVFEDEASECLESSASWETFDRCMEPWLREAADVARLRELTLSLDVAKGRRARRAAVCAWFKGMENIYPGLPARQVALASKWRRKC
jgi:hypothetical protein